MRSQRERRRQNFSLESLEGRLAPSGGPAHGMRDLVDNDGPQAEIQENHRGRDVGQNPDRNDAVDNDPNDAMEHRGGVDPNDGPGHDRGDDHGGRGRGPH